MLELIYLFFIFPTSFEQISIMVLICLVDNIVVILLRTCVTIFIVATVPTVELMQQLDTKSPTSQSHQVNEFKLFLFHINLFVLQQIDYFADINFGIYGLPAYSG